jgi:hypothetical protein
MTAGLATPLAAPGTAPNKPNPDTKTTPKIVET